MWYGNLVQISKIVKNNGIEKKEETPKSFSSKVSLLLLVYFFHSFLQGGNRYFCSQVLQKNKTLPHPLNCGGLK